MLPSAPAMCPEVVLIRIGLTGADGCPRLVISTPAPSWVCPSVIQLVAFACFGVVRCPQCRWSGCAQTGMSFRWKWHISPTNSAFASRRSPFISPSAVGVFLKCPSKFKRKPPCGYGPSSTTIAILIRFQNNHHGLIYQHILVCVRQVPPFINGKRLCSPFGIDTRAG